MNESTSRMRDVKLLFRGWRVVWGGSWRWRSCLIRFRRWWRCTATACGAAWRGRLNRPWRTREEGFQTWPDCGTNSLPKSKHTTINTYCRCRWYRVYTQRSTIYLLAVDVYGGEWVDSQQNVADVGVNNVVFVALFQLFDYRFLRWPKCSWIIQLDYTGEVDSVTNTETNW